MNNTIITDAFCSAILGRIERYYPFDTPELGWSHQVRALRRVLQADAGAVTDQTRVAVSRALLGVARDARGALYKRPPARDELKDYEGLVAVICDLKGALEARGGR